MPRLPDLRRQLQLRGKPDVRDTVDLHGQSDLSRNSLMHASPYMCGNGNVSRNDIVQRDRIHMCRPIHVRRIDYVYGYQHLSGNGDMHWRCHLYSHKNVRADLDLSG